MQESRFIPEYYKVDDLKKGVYRKTKVETHFNGQRVTKLIFDLQEKRASFIKRKIVDEFVDIILEAATGKRLKLEILIRINHEGDVLQNLTDIHAFYGKAEAIFRNNGEIILGKMPSRQTVIIKEWIVKHRECLQIKGELSVGGEILFLIDSKQHR